MNWFVSTAVSVNKAPCSFSGKRLPLSLEHLSIWPYRSLHRFNIRGASRMRSVLRSQPDPKNEKPCLNFARSGTCVFGDKCPYLPSHSWPEALLKERSICRSFLFAGTCRQGGRCKFVHDRRGSCWSISRFRMTESLIQPSATTFLDMVGASVGTHADTFMTTLRMTSSPTPTLYTNVKRVLLGL